MSLDLAFNLALFGSTFITLLVIMDPPGSVPVFLGLMGGRTRKQVSSAALMAVFTSMIVITTFAIFGEQVLRYMKISLPALQGAGGLLLLIVSLELLTGESEEPTKTADTTVAMVPLGTPLLAGPGAIVATILAVRSGEGVTGAPLAIATAIVAVHVVIYFSLRYSGVIARVIKPAGIRVVARLAGLLLAAIAVQLMADSVFGFIANS